MMIRAVMVIVVMTTATPIFVSLGGRSLLIPVMTVAVAVAMMTTTTRAPIFISLGRRRLLIPLMPGIGIIFVVPSTTGGTSNHLRSASLEMKVSK
jgi:hypothetical protein